MSRALAPKLLRVGTFTLDLERMSLRGPAGQIEVRRKTFDVLRYLAEHAGRVVPKEELIKAVWPKVTVGDDSLTKCVSELRRALGNVGRETIKTVPRRGYLVDAPICPSRDTTTSLGLPAVSSELPLPERPSIAVLPFNNTGSGTRQDYLADGITEDITTELSRFSELFVIAQNSSFQYKGRSLDVREIGRGLGVHYVLEGGIRRSGHRIRITAQLIDALTGAHRWADRYDRDVEDVFDVQDEVVRTIVSILAAHVNNAEVERTLLKRPSAWRAHDFYMKATSTLALFWRSLSPATLYETRRLLDSSLSIDSDYARALATLSNTYVIAWTQPLDDDFLTPTALERAHQLARKAVQADANLPQAHAQLGWVLSRRAEHDLAVSEFEKAVDLNPNFTDHRFGAALVYAGEPSKAMEVLASHMRLDPFYAPIAPAFLGLAHYMLKQYAEAVIPLRECIARAPNFRPAHVWLAASYARLGQMREARAEAAEVLRIEPTYTITGTSKRIMRFKNAKDAAHIFAGLRKAGLPET